MQEVFKVQLVELNDFLQGYRNSLEQASLERLNYINFIIEEP
jgi:hypothetical protein